MEALFFLKSPLSEIDFATAAFFQLVSAWYIIYIPFFYSKPNGVFMFKVHHINSRKLGLSLIFFFFFGFIWPPLQGMEVPRLGVKSELHLQATATAMPDPSHICDLRHSSWQHQILNPLSEAKDRTHNLMDTSQILNLLSHNGNSFSFIFKRSLIIFFKWSVFDN